MAGLRVRLVTVGILLLCVTNLLGQRQTAPSNGFSAEYKRAVALENRGDFAGAVAIYQKLAASGDLDAQNAMGFMYDNGRGLSKNKDKALEWWKRAAQQNHAGAQKNLAWWYERYAGGMERNNKIVLEWLRKSARQGYVPAMYHLGDLLAQGWDDNSGRIEAVQWFQLAARPGPDHQNYRADARKRLPQVVADLQAQGLARTASPPSDYCRRNAVGRLLYDEDCPSEDDAGGAPVAQACWQRNADRERVCREN